MDRFGNAFSSTFTDGALGTPVVPGTGLSVSMSGRGFWTDPRYPARVGPRKRPRTICSPMLAIRKGYEIMAWGTPGADVIPQAQTQVFLNNQLWGLEPQEAVEAPRFASYSFPQSYWPHSHEPGVLRVEDTIPADVGDELTRRGHKVVWWPSRHWLVGSVSCVKNELDKGLMKGGSDHRRGAYVLGW
jgi:gamma-glutamyltranspeptidase/glutathione hydrolase